MTRTPAPHDKPVLEINALRKLYRAGGLFSGKQIAAVDGVSLTLDAKPQVFSIVGESGSGKTTLARMILRLVEPTSGSIRLGGRPLTGKDSDRINDFEFRRLVQPIFQNPFEAFSAYLPLDSYLINTAKNLKVAEKTTDGADVVETALRSVGLSFDRVRGKYIRQFSGGELQRISIARALIPSPRLIVADEPVSMVDASLRMNIINLFKMIKEETGVSFVYITHDLSTAYYLSDSVVIMNRGRVVDAGAPQEILADPREAYTRELMGAIPRLGERWPEIEKIKAEASGREAEPLRARA
ncbi:ABC transporter ATP-binding protein [Kaistia sp. MMO-174]|uniref:ABC transporter ATP-binding protein n=1 Tax=Kaistia sp. MMO-174 TaxID=3081256 RepID=UPI001ACBD824|nr:ABC transporter ATP-binding protein [Hyphomicrobiales bacterium]